MAERDANAGRDELCDETRRHHFGRQGDQQHAFARRRQQREIVLAWRPDMPHVVHARLFRRQIRSFEVDPEDARLATDDDIGGVQRKPHLLRGVGDQGRQQARRSEFPMGRRDGADALRRRLVVEQHVAAAVHLHIDESRSEPGTLRQDANGHGARQVRPRHELGDAGAVDDDRGALVHDGAVENMVRRDGVRGTFISCA